MRVVYERIAVSRVRKGSSEARPRCRIATSHD